MIYYYEMTLLLTAKPAACQTHPIQVREGNRVARERRGRDEREEDGPVGAVVHVQPFCIRCWTQKK